MMDGEFAHRLIGDFTVQEQIEYHTATDLYRATQNSLKRIVLFKVIKLRSISATDPQLLPKFRTYLEQIVTLEHLHLQPIYGAGVLDDDHYYITSRMIAGTLADLLQTGALPLEQTFELGLQFTSAIKYVHSRGFTHGSLEPQNVYLGTDQSSYINDLEMLPILQTARTLPQLQVLLNTPFYVSVEQLQFQPVNPQSDIYALGAILYHMVTGVPPFSGEINSFEKVLECKANNQLIVPRLLNPTIPLAVEQIILKALRSNPDERFADIGALQDALKEQASLYRPHNNSAFAQMQNRIRRLLPKR
jgi:serine/threonine protein kinase